MDNLQPKLSIFANAGFGTKLAISSVAVELI